MSTGHFVLRALPVVVRFDCAHDLPTHGSSVAMDIIRTHLGVIIGTVRQEHLFLVPPDQFLVQIRQRRSARQNGRMAS